MRIGTSQRIHAFQTQRPFVGAIELTPIDVLLKIHEDMIERLFDCIAPETPELQQALTQTVHHFVAWVHQLPASEVHHHSYLGGLLTHSLEVALWSAESARGRLGSLSLPGWERRRQERTFILAVALAGLLHDLGKPVADLLIHDPVGRIAWNPYRGSLIDWAQSHGLTHYHLQWIRGRGSRHRGFSVLFLRSIVAPELFDRIREVGPELESSLLRVLSQEGGEDDPASRLVVRADQESTVRSLRDPRRQTDFGGPAPERILIHAIRHLVFKGIWVPNCPGHPLWILNGEAYLVWPRAAHDLQMTLEQDRLSGIPIEADLLLAFMQDRGLLAPMMLENEIPTPLQTIHPEGLDVALRMLQLRSPRLIFDGVMPESRRILNQAPQDEIRRDPEALEEKSQSESIPPSSAPNAPPKPTALSQPMEVGTIRSTLKDDLLEASDRYEWKLKDHHLFIPHPEASRVLGIEPIALIEALEALDCLVPGGAGNLRKVRVIDGRRGLLLNKTVSEALVAGMKVPKKKSRRAVEPRA